MTEENICLSTINPEKDFKAFYEMVCDTEISSIIKGIPEQVSLSDCFKQLQLIKADKALISYSIKIKGVFAGFIGLSKMTCDGVYEFGYFLHSDYRRKGCGSIALKLFCRRFFEFYPEGILFAEPKNEASRKVLIRNGFISFGKRFYLWKNNEVEA